MQHSMMIHQALALPRFAHIPFSPEVSKVLVFYSFFSTMTSRELNLFSEEKVIGTLQSLVWIFSVS